MQRCAGWIRYDMSRESGQTSLSRAENSRAEIQEREIQTQARLRRRKAGDLFAPSPWPPPALSTPPRVACPLGAGVGFCGPSSHPLLVSLGHKSAFHLFPGCMIRNPGSSTNLEGLDIPVVGARTNKAWRRAAGSYPLANLPFAK